MVALTPTTNPIEWQEVKHQQRNRPAFMRRWWFLAPLGCAAGIAAVALTLGDVTSPTRDLAILFIWLVQALVAIRAIVGGANAISREHDGRTWDSLVMTGVSTRKILLGKWVGVMHRVAPWMLALGVVRLVILPVFMMALVNRFAWFTASRGYSYSSANNYSNFPTSVDWVPWAGLLAVGMTLLLTFLEVGAGVALGLATSAVTRRGWLALVSAVGIRLIPVIAFGAFTRYQFGTAASWRVLRFTPLAVADGGSASLYQLVLPLTNWTNTAHSNAIPGLILASLLLTALLTISLVIAHKAINAAGALPDPSSRSSQEAENSSLSKLLPPAHG